MCNVCVSLYVTQSRRRWKSFLAVGIGGTPRISLFCIAAQIMKAVSYPGQDWRSWLNVCVLNRRGEDTTCASCAS